MTSITIIGSNGALFEPIVKALESDPFREHISFPIRVVSRKPRESTAQIQYICAELHDEHLPSLIAGTDVIIELVRGQADLFEATEKLAHQVKPKLFIPSSFGADCRKVDYLAGLFAVKMAHSQRLRASGIRTVDIETGFFAAPGAYLYEYVGHVGLNRDGSYDLRGDIDQEISVTLLEDVGNTVAAVVVNPNVPDLVRVESEKVTIRTIYELYAKTHGVELRERSRQTKEEALAEAQEKFARGYDEKDFHYYLHVLASQGEGKGVCFEENEREVVNGGERLWRWKKYNPEHS